MIAIAAVLFALPIEFGLSGGVASAETISETVRAPMFRARAGVDLLDLLSLNATVLGSAQTDPHYNGCCTATNGSSLRAISALGSLRLHNSGDLQGFLELGGGVGHLVELTPSQQFENPAMRGRGGFSWLVGAGGSLVLHAGAGAGRRAAMDPVDARRIACVHLRKPESAGAIEPDAGGAGADVLFGLRAVSLAGLTAAAPARRLLVRGPVHPSSRSILRAEKKIFFCCPAKCRTPWVGCGDD